MAGRRETKSQAFLRDGHAPESEVALLARRIEEICLDAIAAVPPAKIEEAALQWLSKKSFDPDDASTAVLIMEAFALSSNLVLFAPSLTGFTPIDRYIRQRRADAGKGARAMAALRRRASI